jgi:ubiquinone/menaquinone biosynthesis C-methylase UbiE
MSNPWDLLSSPFDTKKDEIDSLVADNILIAWPEMLSFIKEYGPKGLGLRLLEYGCGGGGFAHKLTQLGYKVTGVDSSSEMINIAKTAYGDEVNFLFGNSSILSTLKPFSIITSVMTLQFIEDIEKTLDALSSALVSEGILTFAVHNPKCITAHIKAGILFEDFESVENPKKGILNFDGIKIPIFIRTASEYNEMLQKRGFKPLVEAYPPFTKEFLEKYPIDGPTEESEFLILGYKKSK